MPPASALPPPDFAIVGAPKCGTTALYSYLAAHPGVAMSRHKEPCFWSRDVDGGWWLKDRADYDAQWAGTAPGALRGEASPVYLQSLIAIPDLLAARPDVRLIAMIRSPVQMAASRHAQLLTFAFEDVPHFEAAWRLQDARLRGAALPRRCSAPGMLQYRANAMIGDQLERFLALAPPAQRIVIVYDDFRADPGREYRRALALLGLDDDGRTDFAAVNRAKALRWHGLHDLRNWLVTKLPALHRPARAAAHAMGIHPFGWLRRANLRTAPRRPLRPEFERELIAEFLPQIEKVERLLGRDLAAWKTPG
jgi:hypothetical protein